MRECQYWAMTYSNSIGVESAREVDAPSPAYVLFSKFAKQQSCHLLLVNGGMGSSPRTIWDQALLLRQAITKIRETHLSATNRLMINFIDSHRTYAKRA